MRDLRADFIGALLGVIVVIALLLLTACGGSADPIDDPHVDIGKPACAASAACT